MQVGVVLLTILLGLRHLLPGESSKGGAFDAFCPLGGIETLWAYITTGQTLKTTNLLNFAILMAVVGVSLVAGRAFCGWMCPIGTLQDMFTSLARRLGGEKKRAKGMKSKARFPIHVPPKVDKWLRYLKYVILALMLIASVRAIYPPLHDICPARAIFAFHLDTPLLVIVLLVFVLSSLFINRFSCKYLCPLGAALAIFNKISPIHLAFNENSCSSCGRCENECLMDIPDIPENSRSAECIRCLECMETCAISDTVDLELF